MTNITIQMDENIVRITGVNHAFGSPETCHGISTMFYALEGFLANNEVKVKNHSSDLKGGYAFIEFEPISDSMKSVLSMFYIGLAQVVKCYENEYANLRVDSKFLEYIS